MISARIPPLPWEILGFSPASGRSLPWMAGQEEQQPGRALVPLPDSCNCNGEVYAASLTLAEGICFISALCDMQSSLVKCQSAKLYFRSARWTQHDFSLWCFVFFSLKSLTLLYYYFTHHNKAVIYVCSYIFSDTSVTYIAAGSRYSIYSYPLSHFHATYFPSAKSQCRSIMIIVWY